MKPMTLAQFAHRHEAELDGKAATRVAAVVDDIVTGDDREVVLMEAADVIRVLHGLVELLLDSAAPHPTEHPTMWAAWNEAQRVSLKPPRVLR